ncbi:hypothetical protein H6G89_27135 [Oscillatoria sp. FACHB-1407]|uniref:hypothetical protein n=1 Tax=Oscillatoria sp. FACHB-1407 TaxID=2692847 RepID=UPI001682E8CC|nr:hypothetical protein [Oscillatoria sp. FACHB-1407]MBD2464685.1 hypothetical protein [Oscillatoria sp. FACHB-1407]
MDLMSEEFYHGWMIQVAQEQMGYSFQCFMAEQQNAVTDAQSYLTVEQALCAGRLRADLESVRLSLTTFLRGKLQFLWLNSDERNALEHSIAQYIDAAKHQLS